MANGFTHDDVPDQRGRTALVTGANTGIGFQVARVLAARGARTLLGCRSVQRGEEAAARIRRDTPGADVAVVELDQASLASVAAAADHVTEREERLDLLVNNAGVMAPPYRTTEDGFELQLGVNHLGTFALTGGLLPMLRDRPGARIVTTSSIAHTGGRLFLEDLDASESYDAEARYRQSKLANLLFALELDRRLRAADAAAISVACHPGIAATDLVRNPGPVLSLLLPVVRPIVGLVLNTPLQGAWPTLLAATGPDVEGGEYLGPTGRREMSGPAGRAEVAPRARDEELAARLWDVSVELTGVDPGV